MCVSRSVRSNCSVLLGCNCSVCAVVVLLRAAWRRRICWGRMEVVLAELYLVLRDRACFRQKNFNCWVIGIPCFSRVHVQERGMDFAAGVGFCGGCRDVRGRSCSRSVRELGAALGLCAFGWCGLAFWKV